MGRLMGMVWLLAVVITPSSGQGPPSCAMDYVTCSNSGGSDCCNSLSQLVVNPQCFCQLVQYVGPFNAAGLNQNLFDCSRAFGTFVTIDSVCGTVGQGPPSCAMDFITCSKSGGSDCCNSLSQLVANPQCFCQLVQYIGPFNAAGLNQNLFDCSGTSATIDSVCGPAVTQQPTTGMSSCQIKLKNDCQNINPSDTQSVCCPAMKEVVKTETKCYCDLMTSTLPVNYASVSQSLAVCNISDSFSTICKLGSTPSNGTATGQATLGMSSCQIKLKNNCQNINPSDTQSICCPAMKEVVKNETKCYCDLMTSTLPVNYASVSRSLAVCNIPDSFSTICNLGSAPAPGPNTYTGSQTAPIPHQITWTGVLMMTAFLFL